MSDKNFGTQPNKIFLRALLVILRQCVDPEYRNYYYPYTLDVSGKPTDSRFFGERTGIDHVIMLAQNVESLASEIETADPDGLPDNFNDICVLYNRWYEKAKHMHHEYDFTFPAKPHRRRTLTPEPEFDLFNSNNTADAPPVPYPAATTADDETRTRLNIDRRYATGEDRSDILDRLKNSN